MWQRWQRAKQESLPRKVAAEAPEAAAVRTQRLRGPSLGIRTRSLRSRRRKRRNARELGPWQSRSGSRCDEKERDAAEEEDADPARGTDGGNKGGDDDFNDDEEKRAEEAKAAETAKFEGNENGQVHLTATVETRSMTTMKKIPPL